MSAQEANRSVIERAAALQMSEVLEDPDQLRALIVQLGDQATMSELKVLWETAVAQKALASVLLANGDGTAITEDRCAGWAAGESVLRTALTSSVSADLLCLITFRRGYEDGRQVWEQDKTWRVPENLDGMLKPFFGRRPDKVEQSKVVKP